MLFFFYFICVRSTGEITQRAVYIIIINEEFNDHFNGYRNTCRSFWNKNSDNIYYYIVTPENAGKYLEFWRPGNNFLIPSLSCSEEGDVTNKKKKPYLYFIINILYILI